VSKLNLNRLIDNKQNCIEALYYKYKDQKVFEFDISNILNKKLNEIKSSISVKSKYAISKDPNEEIVFHVNISEIFGDLRLWFFNPNESLYQIVSLSFTEDPLIPNGIFGKQDQISISIKSTDSLRLNYNLMGEHFKSIEMQGLYDVLAKAYFAKKIKSSSIFKDVILKISVDIDHSSREILETCNFNIREMESAIHSAKNSLVLPLSVFFLDKPDYDKHHSLYLKHLNLSKFHFKTEDAYRRFLQYISNNSQKTISILTVEEFQRLDDAIIQAFRVLK